MDENPYRKALAELVEAIERKWSDEPRARRANALSPRIERALEDGKRLLEQSR